MCFAPHLQPTLVAPSLPRVSTNHMRPAEPEEEVSLVPILWTTNGTHFIVKLLNNEIKTDIANKYPVHINFSDFFLQREFMTDLQD